MAPVKIYYSTDAIGYLIRAATYLAKGDRISAILMLETLKDKNTSLEGLGDIIDVLRNSKTASKARMEWAEKILDRYKRMTVVSDIKN